LIVSCFGDDEVRHAAHQRVRAILYIVTTRVYKVSVAGYTANRIPG